MNPGRLTAAAVVTWLVHIGLTTAVWGALLPGMNGEVVIAETDLRVPDPDLRVRPFLAIPLLELDPAIVLPDTGERLAALVDTAERRGLVPAPEATATLRAFLQAAAALDPAGSEKDRP